MSKVKFVLFLLPFYFVLPVISDEQATAYYAIGLTMLHSIYFWRYAFRTKSNLFSPVSMFVSMYNLYFVLGVVMWLVREAYFTNMDGNISFTLQIYALTSYILSLWGCLELYSRPMQEPHLGLNQLTLAPFLLLFLFFIEYLGIYLFTAGFKVIPLFQTDIDEARMELNAAKSAGAGIGAILIYSGVLCILHAISCRANGLLKLMFFVIAYIPFLLYGGRLLMVLPLLVLLIIFLVKRNFTLGKGFLFKSAFAFVAFFGVLMLYGTTRKGEEVDMELFMNFMTADLFPEFRGSVTAHYLNKEDLSVQYVSMVFANLFPGGIAAMMGIDKAHQINVGRYIADLFGYDLLGIRTSITGELMLTNAFFYVFFWTVLLMALHILNTKYFAKNIWGKDKVIYMYIGLFLTLVIPYGLGLLPNTIILAIVLIMLKMIAYPSQRNYRLGKTLPRVK